MTAHLAQFAIRERRLGQVLPRLALAALGTLAGLGVLWLAEATSRALFPASGPEGLVRLHDYSDVYGWTPRPGTAVREDGHTITINGAGYRGRPVEDDRGDATRVVMLGDSIAFGLGVGDDQTFSAILDARHNGLEVVNLAVQGYGLGQSLLKLEREGLALDPDIVVLNVCLSNDVADTMSRTFLFDGRHPKPYFEIEEGQLVLRDAHLQLSAAARLGQDLRRRSRFFAWIATLTRRPAAEDAGFAEHWLDRRERLEASPGAERLAHRILARMRQRVEGAGAEFIVLLHPDWHGYFHGSRWTKAILRAPELEGVQVIELRTRYRASGLPWRRIATDDVGHLKPSGHAFLAGLLETELAGGPHRRSGVAP